MLDGDQIRHWIEANLEGAEAQVSGDGTHFEAVVICPAFEGRSMLEQHRMVYEALGPRMGNEIHALSLRTYTPEAWSKAGR